MFVKQLHTWDISPAEAIRMQVAFRDQVIAENCLGDVRTVAGVDVGVRGDKARAAVVILSFPGLSPLETAVAEVPVEYPYVPGLLAFREAPAILAACETLRIEPDLFIFDGHGLAHPRRLGIACHVGLFLDRPTIGCAKSRLCGEHAGPGLDVGAWVPLLDGEETIGAVVRTRYSTKPLYVSIGHRVDLQAAIYYVVSTCKGYRLPEPCRLAHRTAGGG
jgi:deoxyribonuclease V